MNRHRFRDEGLLEGVADLGNWVVSHWSEVRIGLVSFVIVYVAGAVVWELVVGW